MGYNMHSTDCQFEISGGTDADGALEAIRALRAGGVSHDREPLASDLGFAFALARWALELNSDASAWTLRYFAGENAWSGDMDFFRAVAPFVKPGSYIEMCGEDGTSWRWIFDGTTVEEKYPKVIW